MMVVGRIGDRFHTLAGPEGARRVGVASLEGEQSPFGRSVERLQQVLDRWIVSGIADEHQLEWLHETPDEIRRPSVREVGPSEIGAGQDELLVERRRGESVAEPSMEIDDSGPLLGAIGPWQHRRKIDFRVRVFFLEQPVEVGCHQSHRAVRSSSEIQEDPMSRSVNRVPVTQRLRYCVADILDFELALQQREDAIGGKQAADSVDARRRGRSQGQEFARRTFSR
jgi:hypothetical protein